MLLYVTFYHRSLHTLRDLMKHKLSPSFFDFHAAIKERSSCMEHCSSFKGMRNVACGLLAAWAVTTASPVVAANQVRNVQFSILDANISVQNIHTFLFSQILTILHNFSLSGLDICLSPS